MAAERRKPTTIVRRRGRVRGDSNAMHLRRAHVRYRPRSGGEWDRTDSMPYYDAQTKMREFDGEGLETELVLD